MTNTFEHNGITYYIHPKFTNYAINSQGTSFINGISRKSLKIDEYGRTGYFRVQPFLNGKQIDIYLHRFVYEAVTNQLLPNDRTKCVKHLDNNKHNCSFENLMYDSQSNNIKDAFRDGLKSKPKGRGKPIAIIAINLETNEETKYSSMTKAGLVLKINCGEISKICQGKNNTAESKDSGVRYSFKKFKIILKLKKNKIILKLK